MAKNNNAIDAIVTLGLQLEDNGEPKPELAQRVAKAVSLLSLYNGLPGEEKPVLIMSGDHSATVSFTPPRTEAEVMTEQAMALGVPETMLIKEDQSLCTWGNGLFTRRITDRLGLRQIVVVSSDYHLQVGMTAFRHIMGSGYDIKGVASSRSPLTAEQAAYKSSATVLAQSIVENTAAGDTSSIETELAKYIPAYANLFGPQSALAAAA
jgi:uncharacterized SAM-binding protein YcdF (DUF218 family)